MRLLRTRDTAAAFRGLHCWNHESSKTALVKRNASRQPNRFATSASSSTTLLRFMESRVPTAERRLVSRSRICASWARLLQPTQIRMPLPSQIQAAERGDRGSDGVFVGVFDSDVRSKSRTSIGMGELGYAKIHAHVVRQIDRAKRTGG